MNPLKRILFLSTVAVFAVMISANATTAQLRLPRPSQKASVMQTIGVTDITVIYNRPGVKGRTVWGDAPPASTAKGEATLDGANAGTSDLPLVPYGHVWRTGANEATQFIITDDVMINGQKLPAGSYSLHTIPAKDQWTIVFNGTANQWGSFSYDPTKDTLRVKAKPMVSLQPHEWLQFAIEPTADNSATVMISWEKLTVPFTVSVDLAATTMAHAREAVAAAKADDWRTPFNASGFANQNGAKPEAAKWIDQSLKALDGSITAKPTFQNLSAKATVLIAAGRKDEGLAIADKAIAQGKADKTDTAAFEKRMAAVRAGKQ